jgi:hypothetical protein
MDDSGQHHEGDASAPDAVFGDDGGATGCGTMTACGVICADLASDPDNCGACGRTCVVPGAAASCDSGECGIATCNPGRLDVDGDPINGCEVEDACTAGASCTTSCGSTGTTACVGGTSTCVAPTETCNAADDDCNGVCDDGAIAGCRVGVHRSYGNGHFYTDDARAAAAAPYHIESMNYFHVYAEQVSGTRPLFSCRKPNGMYFLTAATDCEIGVGPSRTVGFWSPTEICGAVPLHRLSHSNGNHFYTLSAGERDNAVTTHGYTSEGIAGWVWPSR